MKDLKKFEFLYEEERFKTVELENEITIANTKLDEY